VRLTLFLDHDCNLRCRYCYNGSKFSSVMPLSTARQAIDMMLAMNRPLQQVGFFGGEPLLHRPLIAEVISYVRGVTGGQGEKPKFVVTTNGTLLDDEMVQWLSDEGFYIGLSIDGTPEAHDAQRVCIDGSGSYAQVAAGLARALHSGRPVRTVSVVGPDTAHLMGASFEHLLGLGVRELSFNINYEGHWDEAARGRFETGLQDLEKRYVDAYRQGKPFRFNLIDRSIVTHVKGGYESCDRCDFGCEEIAVSPAGRLYPCDRLIGEDDRDDVIIGTVETGVDERLRDALIRSKNAVLEDCRDCAILGRCMHWCGCVNYAMTGDVGGVSGLLCWFERRLVEAADRAGAQLFAEKNELFLRRYYRSVL